MVTTNAAAPPVISYKFKFIIPIHISYIISHKPSSYCSHNLEVAGHLLAGDIVIPLLSHYSMIPLLLWSRVLTSKALTPKKHGELGYIVTNNYIILLLSHYHPLFNHRTPYKTSHVHHQLWLFHHYPNKNTIYPLVNKHDYGKSPLFLLNQLSMSTQFTIFNSYVWHHQRVNLHFPMVFPMVFPLKISIFLWFSYGFPIKISIFLWFSYGFPIKTSIFLWFSWDKNRWDIWALATGFSRGRGRRGPMPCPRCHRCRMPCRRPARCGVLLAAGEVNDMNYPWLNRTFTLWLWLT